MLDTVEIQVEACETLRPVVTGNGANNYNPGKYGFVNKVVDGITVTVESVEIKFVSKAFESKVQVNILDKHWYLRFGKTEVFKVRSLGTIDFTDSS